MEWNSVFDAYCVDEKVHLFTSILVRHLDETLPKRTVRMHPTAKPWMTPRIKKELKARQHAYTTVKVSVLISKAKSSYYLSNSKGLGVSQPEKWYKSIYGLATINEPANRIPPAKANEYLAEQLELALVVHNIICASIVQCKYPKSYKHALICPVPKVNPPNDIDNDFRQISVLPQLAKVLEKLQLSLHEQDLTIRNDQHAFTQNRSTVSALACISQKWFNATDNSRNDRMGIHALFLDFRKAFDTVDHGILLRKLA